MRICFLSRRYFPAISGMSVYARNMTKALAELGHDITMISQYRQDELGAGIYGGGPPSKEQWMKVVGLRARGEELAVNNQSADFELDLKEMVETALNLHREQPFDIVHAQYGYPNGLAALEISGRLGIPNVVSIQGGDGHWVGLCCSTHQKAMQAVLQGAMALLIGSKSFADEVVHNHGVSPARFTILPGATEVVKFAQMKEPGSLSTPARLLYHGRVDQRKGILDFILAAKEVFDLALPIKIVVSGIGPDLDNAKNLVSNLGLETITEFLGVANYDHVHEVYKRGDLFISPTYAEGFSNTILEAMAAGLPILSCDVVGVKDCLKHQVNGLLVEAGNIKAIAKAMATLIQNHALRKRLSIQAYKDVVTKYSWQVVAQQIDDVYQSLLGHAPDTSWQQIYDFDLTLADADPKCRFRQAPHLL